MSSTQIEHFIINMNAIQHENAEQMLAKIYTDNVIFIDPIKSIKGLDDLTKYFEDLYKSVTSCHFRLTNNVPDGHRYSLEWVMQLKHKKISNNQEIELNGASFIEFENDKVCYHRDYYDLGSLVYERIPILGSVVKKVRHAL